VTSEKQKSVLIMAEWADPRFQRGVARYAKQTGWHLNLDSIYSQELPLGWRGDGCIAMAGRPEFTDFIQSLEIPVVDVTHQTQGSFPRIHEDDRAIGTLAADCFLNLGFKHFACYRTDSFDVSTVRSKSFSETLAASGYSTKDLLWNRYDARRKVKDWSRRMEWLTRELQALSKPTAIFCIDDRVAVNIIDCCRECGIRIPDEIAVLGVGNLDTACECSAVSISSIRIDFETMGFQAAELLDRIMNGETPPSTPVLLPPLGVEERRSTHTLAVDDPAGQKAIRFMLDHYTSPIDIQDIAEAGGLTRRQFTYITQKELHIAPAKLLEDIRIKKACELLSTTNYTVQRVAMETGLGTALRLQRIFRKRFETSPAVWRKAHKAGASPSALA
jgi:LacI family transcriptional regulator